MTESFGKQGHRIHATSMENYTGIAIGNQPEPSVLVRYGI